MYVPLVEFDGKTLHIATPKSAVKLRLNRTEVVRRKANCVVPIFPLKHRYTKANYSLDGEDGSAVDTSPSTQHPSVPDGDPVVSVTEDVIFDPLIYDCIHPAAKKRRRLAYMRRRGSSRRS